MEPRRLKAAAVALYFRSAITGTSSKRASGEVRATPEEPAGTASAGVERAVECSAGVASTSGDDVVEASEATLDHPLAVGHVEGVPIVHVGDDQSSTCVLDGVEKRSSNEHKAGDETACSSGEPLLECKHDNTEEAKSEATSRKYEVTYEYSPEDEDGEDKELYDACGGDACSRNVFNGGNCFHVAQINSSSSGVSEKKLVLQYIDVLLQADSHGLGLNIQVAHKNPLPQCSQSASSLVVASFRRLHPRDIGPAEATRQIQRGDVLHTVDGEVVHDLQQLHSKLQQKRIGGGGGCSNNGKDAPYVLLRFLRQVNSLNGSDSASTSSLTTEEEEEPVVTKSSNNSVSPQKQECQPESNAATHNMVGEAWLGSTHQVVMIIRELATKNQELQQELVASKLKLAEQNIQLEQLYALYAKTQLENSPALTFTKSLRPFVRRASASEKNGIGGMLKPGSSSKLHSDIEFAVQTERERLQKHYQLQRDIEKRQVATRHQQELQTLKDTMEKKLAMLEVGFEEALKQQQKARVSESSIETCSCGTWMRLQQELYIHQSLDHDGDEDDSECLVCSLLTDARRTTAYYPNDMTSESATSRRMQKVLEVLREYDLLKQKRPQCLAEADFGDTVKRSPFDLENPLQP